jgi:hypothetical protein
MKISEELPARRTVADNDVLILDLYLRTWPARISAISSTRVNSGNGSGKA